MTLDEYKIKVRAMANQIGDEYSKGDYPRELICQFNKFQYDYMRKYLQFLEDNITVKEDKSMYDILYEIVEYESSGETVMYYPTENHAKKIERWLDINCRELIADTEVSQDGLVWELKVTLFGEFVPEWDGWEWC